MNRYSALQTASWFVEQSLEDPASLPDLTPLKLQMLLYYAQCRFLSETGVALFSEDMEAWPCGPVVSKVYEAFGDFGNNQIERVDPKLHIELRGKFLAILQETKRKEGQIHPDDLSAQVLQQAPYREVYDPGKKNKISIDSMLEVFSQKKETTRYRVATKEEVRKVVKEIIQEDWKILEALAK